VVEKRYVGEADGEVLDLLAVIDALPRAIIVTNPEGRILVWNQQAELLYGWKSDEVIGRMVTDVLVAVPDRRWAAEIFDAVRAGEVWTGDFTVLRRDGEPVRVWVTDRPIQNESGVTVAIVGASEDVSEQRLLERRAVDVTDHLRLALDAGELGTFRWDMTTGETQWDTRLEALFGLEPGTFDGAYETWVSMLHPDDRADVLRHVEEAVAAKRRYTIEHRVVWPDGTVRWVQGAGQVTLDESGNATGTIGCTRDVTEQVLSELQRQGLTAAALEAADRERIHRERLQFLSDINDAITAAGDLQELMTNVAKAAVPGLGDWCMVYVLPDDGSPVPQVEIAHSDPTMVSYAHRLRERFPYDPNARLGMAHVIRTGVPEFYPVIDEAVIESFEPTDDERDVLRDLVLRSSIAVPVTKRGRVLGGIQLLMTHSRRHYTADDLTLAEAVASRIAASIDNMRLSDAQRAIASTLQASLLPDELPDIPGVDAAVRYWATGQGVEVGGDFYDVFPASDAEWAVVIGDVCGTGPIAAAVTGLARHTIASAAWHGDDEVTVLRNLNRALRARNTGPFCTVVYGTLRAEADAAMFTFACAGHPLPVVTRADGSAAMQGEYGTLIGVLDDIDVTAAAVALRPGDAIVLYTDGVTDVAPPHGIDDHQLVELVLHAASRTVTAEELADALEAELMAILPLEQRHDDIALLVLRILPRT
jgi:PAS domain S-box-containing protein